jgi:hypothetical protein
MQISKRLKRAKVEGRRRPKKTTYKIVTKEVTRDARSMGIKWYWSVELDSNEPSRMLIRHQEP